MQTSINLIPHTMLMANGVDIEELVGKAVQLNSCDYQIGSVTEVWVERGIVTAKIEIDDRFKYLFHSHKTHVPFCINDPEHN